MEFELEDGQIFVQPNHATLDHWLRMLAPGTANSFAILTLADGDFIQTAVEADAFVIECRTQNPQHHYRAVASGNITLFTVEQVVEAFVAFGYAIPNHPDFFTWANMDSEVGLA
ncbi:MAG: hypothetical protein V4564_24920 [Pseudomonadota bacterium]|uniref:hypothetical protein n=1 Tax=Sphingomonas sp. ERG5 TaxID=1381597 RepID=UPI00054C4674|nr:hypothetical protein [Sphingomonas sp. ERG5]